MLDREREECKRLRVSKRAPNAPIASSDEDDGGELLDSLGGGSLYAGSSKRWHTRELPAVFLIL